MKKKGICKNCSKPFEYKYTTGTNKLHCSEECRKAYQAKKREERYKKLPQCKTEGCTNKAKRTESGLCEACYMRLYRKGTTDKEAKGWTECKDGYLVYFIKGHPLSGKRGMIRAHRYIAYEHYGPGQHACVYCGKKIGWDEITIDHFDNNKQNNNVNNLLIACNTCNRLKGSMSAFVANLTDDGFALLLNSFKVYNGEKWQQPS